MGISPARRIAFDVLCRVASQGAYASELLYTRLGNDATQSGAQPEAQRVPRSAGSRADAALSTEITLGVLRWQRLLDFLLECHLDRPARRLDLEVQIALRMGLYQLRYLERVPAHAAVGEAVELVKRSPKQSAAALVNAVLRRAGADPKISGESLERLLPQGASEAERAAILHSHPTWMVERWMRDDAFGPSRTLALLQANNRHPLLSCAILDTTLAEDFADSLPETTVPSAATQKAGNRVGVRLGRWLNSSLTVTAGNPADLQPFREGRISFQDEASQMVAHLVDARPGMQALDLCAAPGGKTILMARAVAIESGHVNIGGVIAADLHQHRLRSLREQLARTGTRNVSLLALDATQPLPFAQKFDRILVDAPCSGTGTLARNPEIRWRLEPGDILAAHDQQVRMLRHALTLLAPGGRLVYATCSLEPEENEQVVREALAASAPEEFHLVKGSLENHPTLAAHMKTRTSAASLFDRDGFFRTFPPEAQTDGFFAAVIERRP